MDCRALIMRKQAGSGHNFDGMAMIAIGKMP